jgi:hypothetical protein
MRGGDNRTGIAFITVRRSVHVDRWRAGRRAPGPENVGSSTFELRFPCRNLIGVDIEMLHQLGKRFDRL